MEDVRTTAEAELIAEEGYLYGFPLVLMEATRRVMTNVPAGVRPGVGPMNWFTHMSAFPPGDYREVVRPNFDTLYSLLWFDVTDEPVVVSVPDSDGRYYLLPMLDMWTDVFAVVGSRTTGTKPGDYALVPPGWDGALPEGLDRIESPTPIGWVLGRVRTDGVADYEAVHAIQAGIRATPLSVWPEQAEPPAVEVDDELDMQTAPLDAVYAMSGSEVLAATAQLMQLHPPHAIDQPILARLRRIGVDLSTPFDADALAPQLRKVLDAGAEAALQRMADLAPQVFPIVNGWSLPISQMGTYAHDYLQRAMVAQLGLGANRPEDAIYPVLWHDADGAPPTGDVDHVLHFRAGQLPPADAFWSVTMYDGEGFTVPNQLDRYALGDRDPLVYNADGSLDLYLQRDDPGPERRPNWLPAPSGPIGVTLRLYGPRAEVLDGAWTPPPLT